MKCNRCTCIQAKCSRVRCTNEKRDVSHTYISHHFNFVKERKDMFYWHVFFTLNYNILSKYDNISRKQYIRTLLMDYEYLRQFL